MENGYFARSLVGSWRPLDSGPITLYQSLQMAMVQRLGIWTREVTSRGTGIHSVVRTADHGKKLLGQMNWPGFTGRAPQNLGWEEPAAIRVHRKV